MAPRSGALAVAKDNRVYFTNSKSGVHVFSLNDDKQTTEQTTELDAADKSNEPFKFERSIELPRRLFSLRHPAIGR